MDRPSDGMTRKSALGKLIVLPALAGGDTVIVKPSLRGPLSPVAFAYLATQAGLPPGVVNVVQGTGVDVGAELISRPDLSALWRDR